MNRKQLMVTIALLTAHPLFLMLPFMQVEEALPDWFAMAWYGWVMGQVTLLATWAAMASTRDALLRAPPALFLLTLLWFAFIGMYRWSDNWFLHIVAFYSAATALWTFVLVFGTVHAGSWISRWKLSCVSASASSAIGLGQFQLWHLLAMMGGIGVLLGLGRIVLPADGWELSHLNGQFIVMQVLPFSVWVLGNTLLVAPACLWGSHLEGGPLAAFVLCIWPIYAGLAALVEIGILASIGESMLDSAFVLLFTLNMAQGICLVASLFTLRWAGWRLVRVEPSVRSRVEESHAVD